MTAVFVVFVFCVVVRGGQIENDGSSKSSPSLTNNEGSSLPIVVDVVSLDASLGSESLSDKSKIL